MLSCDSIIWIIDQYLVRAVHPLCSILAPVNIVPLCTQEYWTCISKYDSPDPVIPHSIAHLTVHLHIVPAFAGFHQVGITVFGLWIYRFTAWLMSIILSFIQQSGVQEYWFSQPTYWWANTIWYSQRNCTKQRWQGTWHCRWSSMLPSSTDIPLLCHMLQFEVWGLWLMNYDLALVLLSHSEPSLFQGCTAVVGWRVAQLELSPAPWTMLWRLLKLWLKIWMMKRFWAKEVTNPSDRLSSQNWWEKVSTRVMFTMELYPIVQLLNFIYPNLCLMSSEVWISSKVFSHYLQSCWTLLVMIQTDETLLINEVVKDYGRPIRNDFVARCEWLNSHSQPWKTWELGQVGLYHGS